MSNPIAATSGSRCSASRRVPLRDGSGVQERGNISYQAPKRAGTGSTTTSSGGSTVVGSSSWPWIQARTVYW